MRAACSTCARCVWICTPAALEGSRVVLHGFRKVYSRHVCYESSQLHWHVCSAASFCSQQDCGLETLNEMVAVCIAGLSLAQFCVQAHKPVLFASVAAFFLDVQYATTQLCVLCSLQPSENTWGNFGAWMAVLVVSAHRGCLLGIGNIVCAEPCMQVCSRFHWCTRQARAAAALLAWPCRKFYSFVCRQPQNC